MVSESIKQVRMCQWSKKNVTNSSLDSLQIDEIDVKKLHKKLRLRRLQPVEEL
jgi:hypothetical protein